MANGQRGEAGPAGVGTARGTGWFREREILIRTDGEVTYLRLRPWMQKLATGVACCAMVWGMGTTGFSLWQQDIIDTKKNEIAEAKLTYESLRTELRAYQGQVADIAQRFAVSSDDPDLTAHVTDIATLSRNLADALRRISTDLDMSEAERERIIKSRDMLHARIGDLESELEATRSELDEVTAHAETLESDLADSARENRLLAETRRTLRGRVTQLEDSLAVARSHGAELESHLSELSVTLASVRAERGRLSDAQAGLLGRVQALTAALEASRAENADIVARAADVSARLAVARRSSQLVAPDQSAIDVLETEANAVLLDLSASRARVSQVEASLTRVVTDLEDLLNPDGQSGVVTLATASGPDSGFWAHPGEGVGDPVARARALIAELRGVHATQKDLVEALSARSLAELDALEAMIERTGVNPTELLDQARAGEGAMGQGGPLIPVALDFGEAARGGFVGAVARLESHVGQLEELRRLVSCVPWVAPVDNFQLTSGFGKRRDPITGQMSRHMGIDLAGITGTPVLATAPGRVTFAGTKTGYGKFVEIDHGCGIVTRYAHLRRISVKAGEEVEHRAQIGTLGSTGRSTGPHVHYEVVVEGNELDPANFLEAGRHVFR